MATQGPTPTADEGAASDIGAWATVKLALIGKELEFTTGPIGRAIVLLAIPMVLEMVMESVFALTDAFFVSRLGTDAVATVGLTEAMISILFAVAIGSGMATTAMVARRIGEKDTAGARVAAAQSIILGLLLTVVVALPGMLFAKDLLRLMGGTPELIASGHGYTRVLFGGSATIMLLFLLNAVFRGAGDEQSAVGSGSRSNSGFCSAAAAGSTSPGRIFLCNGSLFCVSSGCRSAESFRSSSALPAG
jgi:hypothetical protein